MHTGKTAERKIKMFDTIAVGKRIAEFRKQKNLTQTELSDAMGVSFQAVSNWERGNSMPDISKLAELTEILGTSIDELLGKKNSAVEKLAKYQKADIEDFKTEEIAEAAEITKPRILEQMAEKSDVEKITPLLPFLSESFVGKLAAGEYKAGRDIKDLVPFLNEDDVDGFLLQAVSGGQTDIEQFLHFASGKTLAKLATEYKESGRDFSVFLPYLDEDDVKAFALEVFEAEGLKAMGAFLPFMNEEDVDELAKQILGKNSAG